MLAVHPYVRSDRVRFVVVNVLMCAHGSACPRGYLVTVDPGVVIGVDKARHFDAAVVKYSDFDSFTHPGILVFTMVIPIAISMDILQKTFTDL